MEDLHNILDEDFNPILQAFMDPHDFKRFVHHYAAIKKSEGCGFLDKLNTWESTAKEIDLREYAVVSKKAAEVFKKYMDQSAYDMPDELTDLY